jgi:hypothetical protein
MESDEESARLDVMCRRLAAALSPEQRAQLQNSLVEFGKILEHSDKCGKDLLRRLGVRTNLEDSEELLLRLWAAARYVGFSNKEFLRATPRELYAVLEMKAYELELHVNATNSRLRPEPVGDTSSKPIEASSVQRALSSGTDTGNDNSYNPRVSFVVPILETKGWSIQDWAMAARIDFHTANDYLKGATKPYRSTRKKLADSLGVAVEKLPK